MPMVRSIRFVAAVLSLLLLGSVPAQPQSAATASLGGTVRDSSGGVLPVTATKYAF
jgi:hypothetical protein